MASTCLIKGKRLAFSGVEGEFYLLKEGKFLDFLKKAPKNALELEICSIFSTKSGQLKLADLFKADFQCFGNAKSLILESDFLSVS